MSEPLTLVVPVEPRFRALAPELAHKYVELAGGSAADAKTVEDALRASLEALAATAATDGEVSLTFRVEAHGVEIAVASAGHASVIKQPLPASK